MRVISVDETGGTVHLSKDDARLVSNALNKVCNALDVREFATRMGADLGDARVILNQFLELDRTFTKG